VRELLRVCKCGPAFRERSRDREPFRRVDRENHARASPQEYDRAGRDVGEEHRTVGSAMLAEVFIVKSKIVLEEPDVLAVRFDVALGTDLVRRHAEHLRARKAVGGARGVVDVEKF